MATFDLSNRFLSAFGFTNASQRKQLAGQNVGVYVNDYSFEVMTIRGPNGDSMLFADMMDANSSTGVYAPPPMVSFTRSKNLTRTEIDGTVGEVIERFGDRSWEVKIKGILVDMVNHQYPSSQVVKLEEFFSYPGTFAVEGKMFDDLKIKSIYFESVDIAGVQGYEDTIQFSLDARSIQPVEFFLVKKTVN